jgi:hypothetical protein
MTSEKVTERDQSTQDPQSASLTRRLFREAVVEVALQAKQALPACHSRIEAAVKIVLAGDVEHLADGTARVASQSNGTTTYHVINGHCDCPDTNRAPEGWCKHRLSAAIAKRAHALVKQRLQEMESHSNDPEQRQETSEKPEFSPTNSLPQTLITINFRAVVHGVKVQFTLQDRDEVTLLPRLDWLLAQIQIRQRYTRAWENQIQRARTIFHQR